MKDKKTGPFEWAPISLLEAMSDGISIQDLDMRIRYANRSHREVFGSDIVGKLCFEVYELRAQMCDGCPVRESIATGRPASAQRAGFDKQGAPWFADIAAAPLRGPNGEIVGAIETVRNITERKLIEAEADRRNRETAALAEVAMALNGCVGLDDILAVALKRSVEICGAVGGLIRLLDEDSGQLVTRTWYTTSNQPILESILPPQQLGVGVVGRAAHPPRIEIVGDISKTPDAGTDHGKGLLKLGLNSMVVVPLLYKEDLIGTMALGSFELNKFNQVDKGLLSAIAGQISISIAAARLFDEDRQGSLD